jgi:hypothetical protein
MLGVVSSSLLLARCDKHRQRLTSRRFANLATCQGSPRYLGVDSYLDSDRIQTCVVNGPSFVLSFFSTGTSADAHGLSHSSITSSSFQRSSWSFRLCFCLGFNGQTLAFCSLAPGSSSSENSIKLVLPMACSGDENTSWYSLTRSFTVRNISGSWLSISFWGVSPLQRPSP